MKNIHLYSGLAESKSNKRELIENMSKTIVKFSKAVYNQPLSPNYIELLEKMNLRQQSTPIEKKKKNNEGKVLKKNLRKFTCEPVQILNLPRLPYGQHLNYEENGFIKKHFVELNNFSDDDQGVKNFDKQFRMQRKIERKSKKPNLYSPKFTNNLKRFLVFKSDAGELKCRINESVVEDYMVQKEKFKVLNATQSFEKTPQDRKLQRKEKMNISLNDIENILKIEKKNKDFNKKISLSFNF